MFRFSFLLCLTTLSLHAVTCACTIPVFRYALDRWETDRFKLTLPASAAQDAVLRDLLRPLRANGKANLDIITSPDPAVLEAGLRDAKTGEQKLWQGRLDQASLAVILDSPARKQITDRILAGESVVWVLVDNGTAESAAEIERIEKRLKFLEQVAALPIQDPNDPDSQLGPGPALKLRFTSLRLRHDDPAESVFIPMLAGAEGKSDPKRGFAAAVFGKGRVLGSWPLDALDDASLEEACLFLVGRCSCRLKNENPGWDLLLNVDWPRALADADQAKKAVPAAATPVTMNQPETVVTQATSIKEVLPVIKRERIPQGTLLISISILLMILAWHLSRQKK